MDTGPPTSLPDAVCSVGPQSQERTSVAGQCCRGAGGLRGLWGQQPAAEEPGLPAPLGKAALRGYSPPHRRVPGNQEGYLGFSGGRKKEHNSPTVC